VVEKSTELGIQRIIPLITDRVIKKSVNKERLQKIATEASEQSGRISVPEIREPQKLKDFLEENKGKKIYFAHINEKEQVDLEKESIVFVGPEGGWTDGEISLLEEYKGIPLSLGKNVLRAETAAIVASFKMQ
jgi:16S rRNA (uracil1498-N3)-methyltransferase